MTGFAYGAVVPPSSQVQVNAVASVIPVLGVITIPVRSFPPGEVIVIVTSVIASLERGVGTSNSIMGGNFTVLLVKFQA